MSALFTDQRFSMPKEAKSLQQITEEGIIAFLREQIVDDERITQDTDIHDVLRRDPLGYNGAAVVLEAHLSKTYGLTSQEIRSFQGRKVTVSEAAQYILDHRKK